MVYAWVAGNILWMVILHVLGNSFGVSWLEVEHDLRVYAWSPTMKEVHIKELKNGTGDPKFSENIKWGN